MKPLALSALVLVVACAEAPVPAAVDAGADVFVPPGFGRSCEPATGCAKGLLCLKSDYSVKPFCTAHCPSAQVKDYCKQSELAGAAALCVQMPKEFQGPKDPLCLPLCGNLAECLTANPDWEVCAKPSYKNQLLFNDLPTKACQSPSAHGQIQVDPVLCDWQDKAAALPQFAEAKQACLAVCKSILKSCQLWPKGKSEDCCGWACFQWLTPGGKLDNKRLSGTIKCLNTAYAAFLGTPQVCTGWKEQCGELPAWVQAP